MEAAACRRWRLQTSRWIRNKKINKWKTWVWGDFQNLSNRKERGGGIRETATASVPIASIPFTVPHVPARMGREGSARSNPRPSHAGAELDGCVAGERRAIEELSRGGFRGAGRRGGGEGWWTWGR